MSKSSLYPYQQRPAVIVDTAILNYRSKGKKTIIVEGINDKAFLGQWVKDNIRFDGFCGKPLVENIARYRNKTMSCSAYKNCFILIADVDYDLSSSVGIISGIDYFVINDSSKNRYNDLEGFIFNSGALKKLFSSLRIEIDSETIGSVRRKIESVTRVFGKYRAADYKLTNGSEESSILNGINISSFFDPVSLTVDDEAIKERIPEWSKSLDVDELIVLANKIDGENTQMWSLSRGHDITEVLTEYLRSEHGKTFLSQDKTEEKLRLGCELNELLSTNVGAALIGFDAIDKL